MLIIEHSTHDHSDGIFIYTIAWGNNNLIYIISIRKFNQQNVVFTFIISYKEMIFLNTYIEQSDLSNLSVEHKESDK